MKLGDFLSVDNTLVDVRAPTKTRLLTDLCAHAAAALGLDADAVSSTIQKRESLGSTGVGDGVAIPHARIPGLTRALGLLARLQKPLDFDAIDGKPVDIVFLLLLPSGTTGEHLNVLAAVARKLREAGMIQALRHARDNAGLHSAMTSGG
jgi:PTS system nitrogen regulatory IIA component